MFLLLFSRVNIPRVFRISSEVLVYDHSIEMFVFCNNFLRASATTFYPLGLSGLVVFVTLHLIHVRIVSHLGLALRGGASNSTVTVTVAVKCTIPGTCSLECCPVDERERKSRRVRGFLSYHEERIPSERVEGSFPHYPDLAHQHFPFLSQCRSSWETHSRERVILAMRALLRALAALAVVFPGAALQPHQNIKVPIYSSQRAPFAARVSKTSKAANTSSGRKKTPPGPHKNHDKVKLRFLHAGTTTASGGSATGRSASRSSRTGGVAAQRQLPTGVPATMNRDAIWEPPRYQNDYPKDGDPAAEERQKKAEEKERQKKAQLEKAQKAETEEKAKLGKEKADKNAAERAEKAELKKEQQEKAAAERAEKLAAERAEKEKAATEKAEKAAAAKEEKIQKETAEAAAAEEKAQAEESEAAAAEQEVVAEQEKTKNAEEKVETLKKQVAEVPEVEEEKVAAAEEKVEKKKEEVVAEVKEAEVVQKEAEKEKKLLADKEAEVAAIKEVGGRVGEGSCGGGGGGRVDHYGKSCAIAELYFI